MKHEYFLQISEPELRKLICDSLQEVINSNKLTPTSEPEILSLRETADFLNIAPQTLYTYTSQKSIPFIKKGKKLYFRKTHILKWLDAGNKFQK